MSYWTNVAANTQLPPSPDLRSSLPPHVSEFSLTNTTDVTTQQQSPPPGYKRSNLHAIARYESFRPEALACSPPVLLSPADMPSETATSPASHRLSPINNKQQQQLQHKTKLIDPLPRSGVSLGAVSGSQGVAIFRVHQPHAPLLVLSHASNASSSKSNSSRSAPTIAQSGATAAVSEPGGVVSCLSFQSTESSSSLYLAAARGSGVLVWDVSGHSLHPLWGRLSAGGGGLADGSDSHITSLAWKPGMVMGHGSPRLAATTATYVGLWDLRDSSSSRGGGTMTTTSSSCTFKPSLRFGMSQNTSSSNDVSPFLQVACAPGYEVAALNTAGVLSVWDTRMTDRSSRSNGGALVSIRAHGHAGVGLAYLSSNNMRASPDTPTPTSTRWLTWGLDKSRADAVVKIWQCCGVKKEGVVQGENSSHVTTEESSYTEASPHPNQNASTDENSTATATRGDCRLVAQCKPPNLACARVCPATDKDSFITVGLDLNDLSSGNKQRFGWEAQMWKITPAKEGQEEVLKKALSFQFDRDENVSAALGTNGYLGSPIASELGMISQQTYNDGENLARLDDGDAGPNLTLCTLTNAGYITTHVRILFILFVVMN